jgi:hypothetical protein
MSQNKKACSSMLPICMIGWFLNKPFSGGTDMENTPYLYDTLLCVLGRHSNWLDLRHRKTLAWMMVGLSVSKTVGLGAVLTASEVARASGKRAIAATVLAYEAFCRICDAGDLKPAFDHVTVGGIASVLGAARALRLTQAQTVQALNLGIAPNLALYQTRIGDVSMWKGCAYANASRNAVFATLLAQRGLTGPAPVFEGKGGYIHTVHRGPFVLEPFGGKGQPFKIAQCSIKRFPLGQYAQTVVQAALEIREHLPDVHAIAEVIIETLQTAINIMAGDTEKWHPTNRETADHTRGTAPGLPEPALSGHLGTVGVQTGCGGPLGP